MISFSKKKKPEENTYGEELGYDGYGDGYGAEYEPNDFGDAQDGTLAYTEASAVDKEPEPVKTSIKLMKLQSVSDRSKIAEYLMNGEAVVFSVEGLELREWGRVVDYLQGAIFMVGGTISRLEEYSLIVAPKNFDISKIEDAGEEEEAAEEEAEVSASSAETEEA